MVSSARGQCFLFQRSLQRLLTFAVGRILTTAPGVCHCRAKVGLASIIEKADRMYTNNEKEKGGSIYIQSKVLNAKDCLEMHLGEVEQEAKAAEAAEAAEAADETGKGDDKGQKP